jgi:hypothetical protein
MEHALAAEIWSCMTRKEQAHEAVAAMASSDAPLVAQGLTDPGEWGVSGWLSDVLPHLAYGAVAAATYELLA